jgi:hypothetical protein
MFTLFVFKRIRKLLLDVTAVVLFVGILKGLPLLYPPILRAKKFDCDFNGFSGPNSNYKAASY